MNFDRIAPHYWWLERIVFGRALERCRTIFLGRLGSPQRALCIGEGDGRFLQSFLNLHPDTCVDVVERSAAMIRLAQRRNRAHVRYHQGDAVSYAITDRYDLVVTHFVLDSLTADELALLIERVKQVAPGGQWLLSEFRAGAHASRALIWLMYLFFRVTAGLRVDRIPDYLTAFHTAGFALESRHTMWNGFIVAEMWRIPG